MIHNLKPYPTYKDSGLLWLGEVPEHWEVKRNKLFLCEINERSEDGSEELLTVSQYTGVTARRERLSEKNGLLTNAASLIGYKRVIPGDLVVNIMLAWNGSLGVSPIAGIASPAYCVYRPTINLVPRFFHYLFRTPLFTGAFKTASTGVVDSRLRLYPEVFFRLPSLLPPKSEQSSIVRYLDYIDSRIRRYIRAKQKLIKLLEKQKQALIHQAVTRGLDPNVKLKPSGVEWLGDVPEHWKVKPLKYWTYINNKTLPETTDGDYKFSYIDIGSVTTGRVVRPLEQLTFGNAPSRARRIIFKGDTIISTVRTYLKAVLHIPEEANHLIASTGFAVLSPKDGVFPEYLGYTIQSNSFIDQVTASASIP